MERKFYIQPRAHCRVIYSAHNISALGSPRASEKYAAYGGRSARGAMEAALHARDPVYEGPESHASASREREITVRGFLGLREKIGNRSVTSIYYDGYVSELTRLLLPDRFPLLPRTHDMISTSPETRTLPWHCQGGMRHG
jgi:hypothetical protein